MVSASRIERGYDAVVQCDADGQHPPAGIATLLDAQAATGAHMVIGSRFDTGEAADYAVGRLRRMAMRVLARSASKATGTTITDATSGFRVIVQPLLGAFAATFPDNYLGDTYEAVSPPVGPATGSPRSPFPCAGGARFVVGLATSGAAVHRACRDRRRRSAALPIRPLGDA